MNKDPNCADKITQIVEKYMGKGKKISQATRDQAELIHFVVDDIESELLNKSTTK